MRSVWAAGQYAGVSLFVNGMMKTASFPIPKPIRRLMLPMRMSQAGGEKETKPYLQKLFPVSWQTLRSQTPKMYIFLMTSARE